MLGSLVCCPSDLEHPLFCGWDCLRLPCLLSWFVPMTFEGSCFGVPCLAVDMLPQKERQSGEQRARAGSQGPRARSMGANDGDGAGIVSWGPLLTPFDAFPYILFLKCHA